MSEQQLPKGWTPEQIRDVAKHYDCQGEDEAVAEDEKATGDLDSSSKFGIWVRVPLTGEERVCQ